MRPLDADDLRVLRVSARFVEGMLEPLVQGIAADLFAHPRARPYYADLTQVQGQSRAWIRGVLAQPELPALEAFLVEVAEVHHRIGIPADFFVEVCAMIHDHLADTTQDLPTSPEVRAQVLRAFTRVLFRQAAIFCASPAP